MSYAKPKLRSRADAAVEIVAEHVGIVGLVVKDVPDGFQLGVLREPLQILAGIGIGQRNPSDHAADKGVPPGEVQQPFRLFRHLPSLYGYGPVHAGLSHDLLELRHQEIPAERRHLAGHPDVVPVVVLPEVMVRVNRQL